LELSRKEIADLIRAQSVMHVRNVDSYLSAIASPAYNTEKQIDKEYTKMKQSRMLLEKLFKGLENAK